MKSSLNHRASFLFLFSLLVSFAYLTYGAPRGKRKPSARSTASSTLLLDQFAIAHHQKMLTEGGCSEPKAHVLAINTLVPHSISSVKKFDPPSTILHRCNSHSGCCFDEKFSCQPKTMETVDLYFFTIELESQKSSVEKLSFVNHTQCECIQNDSGVFYELK